ncbi:hypothetical protein, partial [Streptomyces spectabilis]|uniref:hypothetical protein n=1 Tax=Streptomyces spectabilis TaxID=68270 RepID=UPI0033DCDC66
MRVKTGLDPAPPRQPGRDRQADASLLGEREHFLGLRGGQKPVQLLDVTIGGVRVPKGETVLLSPGS